MRRIAYSGSNPGAGKTIVDPSVTPPSTPITTTKQWYSGTGMHTRSLGEKRRPRPKKYPLMTMLRCDSVASLRSPVVAARELKVDGIFGLKDRA